MNIGLFDSGFGGLSILRAVEEVLPEYDYVYLGDSARAPYGNHSHEVIYQYVIEAVEYLFSQQNCKLIILACNTASAQSLRRLQQEWLPKHYPDRNVLGVIRPVAEEVAKISNGKKIGVIGTRATISSKVFSTELSNQLKEAPIVYEEACPLLVPMIEEGFHKRPEMKKVLKYYLRPLKQKKVDILINGCTHYQLVDKFIQQVMGKRVEIIDSPQIVAESLKDYLNRHTEITSDLTKKSTVSILTTKHDDRFDKMASQFLGKAVHAEEVQL